MDGITIVQPSFKSCVPPNAPLEELASGFRWLEGPVWFAGHQYLLVNDLPNNRIVRWTPSGGVSVFREPSGFANKREPPLPANLYRFDPRSGSLDLRVFDVTAGVTRLSRGRIFYKVEPGYTDGVRYDEEGNLWSSAGDGVHCISSEGELLGKVEVPFTVSNLCFGGRNHSRLFICASHTLFAIYVNKRGAQRP